MLSSARRGSLRCGLLLAALGARTAGAEDTLGAATASAAVAEAEPPLPPPPPPQGGRRPARRIELDTAPAPSSGAGSRGLVHDGFYLRFGLGTSYGRAFVQTDRESLLDSGVTGIGLSADLWLGWTPAPGLVLGPALSTFGVATGGATIGRNESDGPGTATGVLLGGFVDAYPNPEDGYHFGGVLSLASLTQSTDSSADTDYTGTGVGLSVFAGYDAWIAREWSLGGILRLGGVVTRNTDAIAGQDVTRQGTLYGAALLFTVVHH